jgi:uncharacterized protein DUF2786
MESNVTDEKLKQLLDKIRKLKAKADDPSTTEAESLAFTTKVSEMLAEYGLEEAQLAPEQQDGIQHDEHFTNWNNSPHRRTLVSALCTLYMVNPLVNARAKRWTLIGRKHNIIMVKEMADYLIKTVTRLSNRYGRENPGANIIDFRRGCYKRLSERVLELYREQSKAEPVFTPSKNPGNLPALYQNELQLNRQYLKEHWPSAGTMRTGRTARMGVDALAGRAAGDSISLQQQVGGGRSNHLLEKK